MSDLRFPYGIDATGRTATAASLAEHVRHLMEQVLFTIPGERVMRPDFGTPLRELVFEGASGALADTVRALVHGNLQRWLADRIVVESVEAEAVDARLEVTVAYRIANSDAPTATVTVSASA